MSNEKLNIGRYILSIISCIILDVVLLIAVSLFVNEMTSLMVLIVLLISNHFLIRAISGTKKLIYLLIGNIAVIVLTLLTTFIIINAITGILRLA